VLLNHKTRHAARWCHQAEECLAPPQLRIESPDLNLRLLTTPLRDQSGLERDFSSMALNSGRRNIAVAEIAPSILKVVPVIVEVITTLNAIHKSIKTAKKRVEHLDTIAIDWKIQHGRFLNECVLLLMESGEEEMVGREMAKDPLHAGWSNKPQGPSIEQCLGDSYGPCQKVIKRIEAIFGNGEGNDGVLRCCSTPEAQGER
jgi:hypothetical protein